MTIESKKSMVKALKERRCSLKKKGLPIRGDRLQFLLEVLALVRGAERIELEYQGAAPRLPRAARATQILSQCLGSLSSRFELGSWYTKELEGAHKLLECSVEGTVNMNFDFERLLRNALQEFPEEERDMRCHGYLSLFPLFSVGKITEEMLRGSVPLPFKEA